MPVTGSTVDARTLARPLRFERLEDRQLLSITVNTLIDENDGVGVGGISLRDAIAAAAANETINFASGLTNNGPATILLTHGHMTIDKGVTISGPGSALLTIDASGSDPTPGTKNGDGSRIFYAYDGNFSSFAAISISGLKLTGGDAIGSGGAINSQGENLTLVDTIISGNSTTGDGGAV